MLEFLALNSMSIENLTNTILKKSENYLKEIILSNNNSDDKFEISVFGNQKQVCVGIIDMIDSSKIVAKMPINKSSTYYEIFINHMAKIINHYNGKVLKTTGDGLLFYFPETIFSERQFGFMSCIEAGLAMSESHEELTDRLIEEFLPAINFRISFNYGQVTMVKTDEWLLDLMGTTINICSKINYKCNKNGIVIGDDLYQQVKNIKEYNFKNIGKHVLDKKNTYQIHSVKRKITKQKLIKNT